MILLLGLKEEDFTETNLVIVSLKFCNINTNQLGLAHFFFDVDGRFPKFRYR
jgi:hypothetical protein